MSPTKAKLIGLLVLGGKAQFPSDFLQRNEPFEDSGRLGRGIRGKGTGDMVGMVGEESGAPPVWSSSGGA
jgi:hypothetical protein